MFLRGTEVASTRRSFAGAAVALVTPFTRDGALDEATLRRLVKRQVAGGIDVLVPCGTTGESVTMTGEEQDRVVAITLEEASGRLVVAGAGTNDTRKAIERTRRVCDLGADGVLSVGPYYNKPTPEGFFRHFSAIADASTKPIVVYNVPSRTGSNIDNATMLRLAAHPNITAVKEASGNLQQMMELLRDRPSGFEVLSGDDGFTLAIMAHGGDGLISVAANEIPKEIHDLVAAAARGDFAEASRMHLRLLKLMTLNFAESNPVPVKSAMALMGLCEENYRLPMCPPKDSTREALRGALRELGLLS
jgi:4-hydroxy-tetrahydrodipicolinate synthase